MSPGLVVSVTRSSPLLDSFLRMRIWWTQCLGWMGHLVRDGDALLGQSGCHIAAQLGKEQWIVGLLLEEEQQDEQEERGTVW